MVRTRKISIFLLFLFVLNNIIFTTQVCAMEKKNSGNKKTYNKIQIPDDLRKCFLELNEKLSQDQITDFKNTRENEIAKFHFSIGRWIRNRWQLWSSESPLTRFFNDLGIFHPDDMSEIILTTYHRYLNNRRIALEQQIKYYRQQEQKK